MKNSVPTKYQVKALLHEELQNYAKNKGRQSLDEMVEGRVETYEITNDFGTYQIRIEAHKVGTGDVDLLGAIDGPGVKHFLGWVSSVTDVLTIQG